MEENHSCTPILRVAELKPERICEQLGSLIQTDGLEISLQPSQEGVDMCLRSR